MKTLSFFHRGDLYLVNERGEINANGIGRFSPDWVFLGGSRHHWSNRIGVTLADAFRDPALLNGCLGWDRDHGTTRRWGGRYCGKIPRIEHATLIEAEGAA